MALITGYTGIIIVKRASFCQCGIIDLPEPKAYLEIAERIPNGSNEDSKQLRKHKGEVFRLAVMLRENDMFELPESIKTPLQTFADIIINDLPDKAIFKEMGLNSISVENVLSQIIKSFELDGKR